MINPEEAGRWLHTLDVKDRNHRVASKKGLHYVEAYCCECGKSLSKQSNCFILCDGMDELKDALKAKLCCDECNKKNFVKFYCASCGAFMYEPFYFRLYMWLKRNLFGPRPCSVDNLDDCYYESTDDGFACACPL